MARLRPVAACLLACVGLLLNAARAEPAAPPVQDARELIAGAIDQTRGRSSYAELSMRIHRPDWERTSALKAWTRGREDALIRFTAPPRDAGNATLKLGEQMWTFTPRLNRVIRLPYSMMAQSWAGSDFSYHDLSRSDKLLIWYDHAIADARYGDGHWIYTVESVPHDDAPVVWGKEVVVIRDDYVLLEQTFYDQDMQPVKRLVADDVRELGGRMLATHLRMIQLEEDDHFTELTYDAAEFDIDIDDEMFTLFRLRSGK